MIIDNYWAALYSNSVPIGSVNPPGELNYKGYQRQLFCAIDNNSLEPVTFPKSQSSDAYDATHLVVMTGNGTVKFCQLLTHNPFTGTAK